MQHLSRLLSFLLACSPLLISAAGTRANSALLSQVRSLTLHDGKLTSHRRVSAIPQLTCVGGNAKGLYNVDVMRCQNSGSEYDAEDVQWTCQASLPPEFKLGSTEVICEGYDSPDDPYILKGSCGVEYRLVLTNLGEEKYGKNAWDRAYRNPTKESVGDAFFTTLFWLVVLAVVCLSIYKTFIEPRNGGGGPNNAGRLGFFGGGGGGGDDGNDDPPPPYTPRAPKPSSAHRANRAPRTSSYGETHRQTRDGTWQPGFWTGAATGAAAGYAASALGGRGSRASRQQYDPPQPGPSNFFGRTRDPSPPRTSSRFGGDTGSSTGGLFGGGPSTGRSTYGAGPSSYGSSSSSPPSSSRYESTGFGGTSRR